MRVLIMHGKTREDLFISKDQNDFKIHFPILKENQRFIWLNNIYRSSMPIIDLIRYVQENLDPDSEEGYPVIGEILNEDKLPPPINPSGYDR